MSKNSSESDKERFIRVARELGVDENASVEEFVASLKKILKSKAGVKGESKKPAKRRKH